MTLPPGRFCAAESCDPDRVQEAPATQSVKVLALRANPSSRTERMVGADPSNMLEPSKNPHNQESRVQKFRPSPLHGRKSPLQSKSLLGSNPRIARLFTLRVGRTPLPSLRIGRAPLDLHSPCGTARDTGNPKSYPHPRLQVFPRWRKTLKNNTKQRIAWWQALVGGDKFLAARMRSLPLLGPVTAAGSLRRERIVASRIPLRSSRPRPETLLRRSGLEASCICLLRSFMFLQSLSSELCDP